MTTTKAQLEPLSRVAPLEPPYSPEIAGAVRELTISLRQREIVIDRTRARSGCEYE